MFTPEQRAALDQPLSDGRIAHRTQAGKQLSYIEGWDAFAAANRIFRPDCWSYTLDRLELAGEVWLAVVTVTVDTGEGHVVQRQDVGVGIPAKRRDEPLPTSDAIETAIKGAATDAAKRALRSFGPQFGLDLYDKSAPHAPAAPTVQPARQAPPAAPGNGHAGIGRERGGRLRVAAIDALKAQGYTDAEALQWLTGRLERLQRPDLAALTEAEGGALLNSAKVAAPAAEPAVR